jgi:hypothetical protein
MMGLFTQATQNAKSKKTIKRTKTTVWAVGDPEGDAVGKSVHMLKELAAQEKAIKAKKALHSTVVLKHAKESHVADFCALGVQPESPMKVRNSDGEEVSFVVQDRGGQYEVKPENIEVLEQLLGEEAAQDLLYTEITLGFNRDILAIEGVSEAVEAALGRAIAKLVKTEVLTGEQADELITAKMKTSFKPGTLARAASIVGNSTTKLTQLFDAMGSAVTRYVKA